MKLAINPGILGLALLCFFLPFLDLKCNGLRLMSISGVQLATGADVNPSASRGPLNEMMSGMESMSEQYGEHYSAPQEKRHVFEILLLVAMIILLASFILSLVLRKQQRLVGLLGGSLVLLILIIEYFKLRMALSDMTNEAGSELFRMSISLEFGIGYWMVVLSCIALIIYNALQFRKPPPPPPPPQYPPYPPYDPYGQQQYYPPPQNPYPPQYPPPQDPNQGNW